MIYTYILCDTYIYIYHFAVRLKLYQHKKSTTIKIKDDKEQIQDRLQEQLELNLTAWKQKYGKKEGII